MRITTLVRWIKTQVLSLNLFDSPASRSDASQLRIALVSTRIFIVLLTIIMINLITYGALIVQTETITIENPSQTIYTTLQKKNPIGFVDACYPIEGILQSTLECLFDQTCLQSMLIVFGIINVSSINVLKINETKFSPNTIIEILANELFIDNSFILSSFSNYYKKCAPVFCTYTMTETGSELFLVTTFFGLIGGLSVILRFFIFYMVKWWFNRSFNRQEPITSKLVYGAWLVSKEWIKYLSDKTIYENYVNDDFHMKSAAFFNALATLCTLVKTTVSNAWRVVSHSALITSETLPLNYLLVRSNETVTLFQTNTIAEFKRCLSIIDLHTQSNLIPDDSNVIKLAIGSKRLTMDTPILKINDSRFSPNTSLNIVINELMVDQWNVKIEYEQYYNQCHPQQCSYTFTTRGGIFYILSTIIGIFGGLITILKIVVKIIVKLIRKKIRSRIENTNIRIRFVFSDYIRNLMCLVKKHVLHFNLFESKLSWNDNQRRQTEIITTRLYLILLFVCIIIVLIYTSSMVQTQVFTVKNPSEAIFNQLISNKNYFSTLECPCQNLTIQYNLFVRIFPHFHQICLSDYVVDNSNWIKQFSQSFSNNNYSYDDFRRFIVPQFRALTALCNIAKVTVADALSTFMSATLISKRVESTETIQLQVNSAITQFHLSTNEAFVQMFDHVKDIIKGNRLMSTTLSNWYMDDYVTDFWYIVYVKITMSPHSYENGSCFCGSNIICSSPAIIDGSIVPGFRVGCYPIESLLESTLECLYNVTCINQIQSEDFTSDSIFRSLNSTLSSPTVTVQSLVDALMVDQWETNFTYENYYSACAPLYCSYSVNMRFDKVYVFTTIMGLSGGLSILLKFIVPLLVKYGRCITMFRRRRIEPIVSTVTESNPTIGF
ncbi:hypothetical protein I4U23_011010 [Adineta vaga]|nr:hypothetical protein I4U23_011010 [Adineta vaga]